MFAKSLVVATYFFSLILGTLYFTILILGHYVKLSFKNTVNFTVCTKFT